MQNCTNYDYNNNNFLNLIDDMILDFPNPVEFVEQVSIKFDDDKIMGEARINHFFTMGEYLYKILRYSHAIIIFENCIDNIHSNIQGDILINLKNNSLSFIGAAFQQVGDHHKAIDYSTQSLKFAQEIKATKKSNLDVMKILLQHSTALTTTPKPSNIITAFWKLLRIYLIKKSNLDVIYFSAQHTIKLVTYHKPSNAITNP